MIQTGLVSVTFRNLQPTEIVDLVKQAGLNGIEWGGDVHVPQGNVRRANEVLITTVDAGLQVAAYGSYYRVGCETNLVPFEKVLETAMGLRAPTVRVWAGDRSSRQADAIWWNKVVEDSQRMGALAAQAGINIAFEYHEETLTDTSGSACRFLRDINRTNVLSYWQPPVAMNFDARLEGLKEIVPWLSNLHVFNQSGDEPDPLAEGTADWSQYMDIVRDLPGDRFCMIEFVKGGSPSQFFEDAEALKKICN
jgi:3-dehydroshikimate dehydratase